MMMPYPFGKQLSNSSSNHSFEQESLHRSVVGVRSKQRTFTLCRNQSNSSMTLAADTNIDPFSAFTAHILAIHLRLYASLIDIYELFFGNVFDFS